MVQADHVVHPNTPAPHPTPKPPTPKRVAARADHPLGKPPGLEPAAPLPPKTPPDKNLHPQGVEEEPSAAKAGVSRSVTRAEAKDVLVQQGMSEQRATDYVASFDGTITTREVQPGEQFQRYSDDPDSKGSFLTKSNFATPQEAVDGLYLGPYGNGASTVQQVTATKTSTVLEGQVLNGSPGTQQTVLGDWNAFDFGKGKAY